MAIRGSSITRQTSKFAGSSSEYCRFFMPGNRSILRRSSARLMGCGVEGCLVRCHPGAVVPRRGSHGLRSSCRASRPGTGSLGRQGTRLHGWPSSFPSARRSCGSGMVGAFLPGQERVGEMGEGQCWSIQGDGSRCAGPAQPGSFFCSRHRSRERPSGVPDLAGAGGGDAARAGGRPAPRRFHDHLPRARTRRGQHSDGRTGRLRDPHRLAPRLWTARSPLKRAKRRWIGCWHCCGRRWRG